AHAVLGMLMGGRGQWVDTLAYFRASLLIDEQNVDYLHMYGIACLHTNATEDAIKTLERALALDPRRADVYVTYAEALEIAGKRDEAIQNLQEAVRLDDTNVSYKVKLGSMLRRYGEY